LLDTAGIRDSPEPVEQEGIRRARERAAAADLVLWVTDGSANGVEAANIDEYVIKTDVWTVHNKRDLAVDKLWISSESRFAKSFAVSATAGAGMDGLVNALTAFAKDYFAETETSVVTRARHRRALEECVAALNRALAQGVSGREELIAEELRSAATILGRLTGRVDVEDTLDVIFRDFCIGK
jgi:tRNA modification GTPase